VVQLVRTGSTGFKGIGGAIGSVEWVAGVLFAVVHVVGARRPCSPSSVSSNLFPRSIVGRFTSRA